MISAFGSALCAIGVAAAGAERPASLIAMEQARKAIGAGRIEWAVLPEGDERRMLSFVSRYARNGDMVFENRGDPEGWTIVNPQTGAGVSRFPQLYLLNAEGAWHHQETGLSVRWWKRDGQPPAIERDIRDVRAIGVSPTSLSAEYEHGLATIWGSREDPISEWRETDLDGFKLVVAKHESGAATSWYINPERGWNPERVEYDNGVVQFEAISQLALRDGIWFPQEIRYYRDGALTESVVIRSAQFDQKKEQARFGPADIGVEPGMAVSVQNDPSAGYRTWNGERAVEHDAWLADVKAGARDWGPLMKASFSRGGRFESPYLTDEQRSRGLLAMRELRVWATTRRHTGLWERYVREFIQRYRLTDEQSQRAWSILLDCQRRADEYIKRERQALDEAISQQLAAKEAGKHDEAKKLDERVARLREPIDRIFKRELKPRLDKLPTREQRKAAEQAEPQPATQPVAP